MARNGVGWTRTQPKRDNPLEHSLRSIQPLLAQLLLDTLRSLTRAIDSRCEPVNDLATIFDTRECLIVLRLRTHDATMFRAKDKRFIKGISPRFRRAYNGHFYPHAYFTFLRDVARDLLSQHVAIALLQFRPLTRGETLRRVMEN